MVPRFSSLAAFVRYKSWAATAPTFVPGAERDDLAARMRRHEQAEKISPVSRVPRYALSPDIGSTSGPHSLHATPGQDHIRSS